MKFCFLTERRQNFLFHFLFSSSGVHRNNAILL
jgi:hypothetical protein